MQQQSNTGLIVGIIAATVVLFGGLVFALSRAPSTGPANGPQDEQVSFADQVDPVEGPDRAPVTVHLYEDFQCPACAASHPVVKAIMEKFKDRVRFIWKDFPLEQIHPSARAGANAARCAQVDSKFWEYENVLYTQQDDWVSSANQTDRFVAYAKQLGMDDAKFRTCLTSKTHDGKVSNNLNEGLRNRVDRTPTFFINNKRYFGMSETDWTNALEKELAAVAAASTTSTPVTP